MTHLSRRWHRREHESHEQLDGKLVGMLNSRSWPSLAQLKYLPRVLPRREMTIVLALAGVIIANVLFLSVRFFVAHTTLIAADGGTYSEALVGSPNTINPLLLQQNDVDRDLSRLMYASLVRYTNDRHIEPDLAETYSVSADGKTYSFTVRSDARWHDGKPITADDVVFTFERMKDSAYKSPMSVSMKEVIIAKTDDRTVQLTLPRAFAPFIDIATVGILPRHVWEQILPESFALASVNLRPIGSGPWKFKSLLKDRDGTIRAYTVGKNDDYYGAKAYLSELIFRFYPDTDSAVMALKNRAVDGISFVPRALRAKFAKDKNLTTASFTLPQYTAVFFNQLNNPDLKSLAVRQALSLTVDRDRIIREALSGEGEPQSGVVLPGFPGYDPARPREFNPDKAHSLLQAAGWKKNESGQWEKEKKSAEKQEKKKESADAQKRALSVTLVTVNQEEHAGVAEILKDGWTQLGVSVSVELVDPSRVKQDVIDPRNYEAFLYGEIVGADPDLYPFWHSSQTLSPGLNLALFSNAKADALLEEGRTTSDANARASGYRKFENLLTEQSPAIVLYSPRYTSVMQTKLRGVATDKQIVSAADRFVDSTSWYIKTDRVWKK